MVELHKSVARLSPERQKLLDLLLREKYVNFEHGKSIPRRPVYSPIPLSFAQQGIWFQQQLRPGDVSYVMPMAVCLQGPLDVTALEQSFNEVIRRHEALRTTFAFISGEPVQIIAPRLTIALSITDLSSLPEDQRSVQVRDRLAQQLREPFALDEGPLLRVMLLRCSPNDHVLMLTMHHIVSDGWSIGVLLDELTNIYETYATGKQPMLPELRIQYGDYAMWQRETLQDETLRADLAYWQKQLAGAPFEFTLPSDRSRSVPKASRGAISELLLSASFSADLKRFSQRHGVTLFMTLLVGFETLAHYYTGETDIVVGTDAANRNCKEIEGLIGFFVNQLTLRTDFSGDPSLVELLERVREVCVQSYAHSNLPFDRLVQSLNPERNLSFSPLFQMKCVLQNTPLPVFNLPTLNMSPLPLHAATAKFDLLLNLIDTDEGIRALLEYNKDLYDAATVNMFLKQFEFALRLIMSAPSEKLSEATQRLFQYANQLKKIESKQIKTTSMQMLSAVKRKYL